MKKKMHLKIIYIRLFFYKFYSQFFLFYICKTPLKKYFITIMYFKYCLETDLGKLLGRFIYSI